MVTRDNLPQPNCNSDGKADNKRQAFINTDTRHFKIQMGDMGPPPSPPLAWSLKNWYDHAGCDSRSCLSSDDRLLLGGDVKSVDLVFLILSYQFYIGIMNSSKKKACISCIYNCDDLPSNNSSLHSSHI